MSTQYPTLYNIVQRRDVSVQSVLGETHPNLAFRRALTGNKYERWLHLLERLMDISLTTQPDSFVWGLTNSGVYTVKSMYLYLLNDNIVFLRKYIWKLKVSLKFVFSCGSYIVESFFPRSIY